MCNLGNLLLKFDPRICEGTEQELLDGIEKMAVLHIASTVCRTKLMTMVKTHEQSVPEFFAHLRSSVQP